MIGGLLSLVRTLGLLVALASVFAAPTSWAATKTWNGSDGGSYSPPGNWMPTGLPGTSDAIVFANGTVGSTYDINFDADPTNTQLVVATNPLSFAGATRALSLTSTSTFESSRALIIGTTSAGGTSNAALTTSSQ